MKRQLVWVLMLLVLLMWAGVVAAKTPAPRSMSLKNASNGYLLNSKRLPVRGKHHKVLERTVTQAQHYGSDELVGLLLRASKQVARRFPKSVMVVGNLSRKKGGDLTGSVSHNSGRDADIAFYLKRRGKAVHASPGFMPCDEQGRAGKKGEYSFDVARNWAFVSAVLSDKQVQIQWLFISTGLRKLLLEHAEQSGAPASLIARASDVLGQPGNSSAHSEHFHLRLYCALHERLEGCLNYGTTHSWVDDYAEEVAKRAGELLTLASESNPEKAVAAIKKVGAIRAHSAVDELAKRLSAKRSTVRSEVLKTLMLLKGAEGAVPALLQELEKASSVPWTTQVLEALATIGDLRAAPAYLKVLDAESVPKAKIAVLVGLRKLLWTPAVPAIAKHLVHRKMSVRNAARQALELITNHRFGVGKRSFKKWKKWWTEHGQNDRLSWVKQGFEKRYKIALKKNQKRAIGRLIKLISKGGARAFNAMALIKELTGFSMKRAHFSDRQMYRFYMTWLREGMPRRDTDGSAVPGG